MKTRRENKNFWIRKLRWILRKRRHIAPIVFLGFSRVNRENGSKPTKIHHCHVIFHVVRFWKNENVRLYSIDAAILCFECVCCLPAQHISFVGGRIDVQKRTAEYVLEVLEFTRSYCEETSSSQAKFRVKPGRTRSWWDTFVSSIVLSEETHSHRSRDYRKVFLHTVKRYTRKAIFVTVVLNSVLV